MTSSACPHAHGCYVAYTANLCPLFVWIEPAGFRQDFRESVGELIETVLGSAIRQRRTEDLDGMLGEQQRIDDTVQTGARREARGFRLRREMPGLRSGQMELPLQISSTTSTYLIALCD
jgi:hypothetical protein